MTGQLSVERASPRFWTLSNMLSLSRVVLAIPFVIVMLGGGEEGRWWGFGLVCVGALTDKLDGVLARRRNEVSEGGKILDPLGDKIGVAAIAIVLYLKSLVPGWFLGLLLGRDLLIFAGGMYLRSVTGAVLPSNTVGKWTVGIVGATLALMLVGVTGWLVDVGIVASVAMLAVSLILYAARFISVLRVRGVAHGNS
ncbi:MAG: CDP-alcohol phosphatidyltransferase family protein [Bacteroidota bacterium]